NNNAGVFLYDGATFNVVRDNIIGNNKTGGVLLESFGPTNSLTSHNWILDNWIGVSPFATDIGNGQHGVAIHSSSNNLIGPGNHIANAPGAGVRIFDDALLANAIVQNDIFDNGDLGIVLGPAGITRDDPNVVDFPVITRANARLFVGTACANCTIDVFVSSGTGADRSGVSYVVST